MSDETILEAEQIESVEDPVEQVVEGEAAPVDEGGEELPPTLEEQLAAAQAEATDYKDRWLRVQAEFANARKRMDRQRTLTYQNATADLAAKILPVIDDFERAIANVPAEISGNGWFEGNELVQKKLLTILENFDVLPIDAVGQPFDPNVHEAIQQEPSDEFESGVVMRELQKGYKLGDRVIRPSLVTVAA